MQSSAVDACIGSGSSTKVMKDSGMKSEGCNSAAGYEGKICHQCKIGYVQSAGKCVSCEFSFDVGPNGSADATKNTIVVALLVVSTVLFVIYKFSPRRTRRHLQTYRIVVFTDLGSSLKIMTNFLQVICAMGVSYSIPFPQYLIRFFDIFNFINLDFVSFLRVGCIAPLSFFDKILFNFSIFFCF